MGFPWCEAADGLFLLTSEQSFRIYSKRERSAAVTGQSGVLGRNLSGTAESLRLRLNLETKAFFYWAVAGEAF